tara:strand:+ start:9 stop:734 length:726 start_codon:yes stop_codon:yes gene_type:complete
MNKYKVTIFNLPEAEVELHENFLENNLADQYFKYFSENIKWKQESMNLYGKQVNYARLMSWYGEEGKSYRFSGKTQFPNNWNNEKNIINIKNELEGLSGEKLNSVLLNKYRNENDSISWHSDDEKELGDEPSIYSYSLGCSRIFKLKRKDSISFPDPLSIAEQSELFGSTNQKTISTCSINLNHNSLLIMRGKTQEKWLHAIDKVPMTTQTGNITDKYKKLKEDKYYPTRINMTFRYIKNN